MTASRSGRTGLVGRAKRGGGGYWKQRTNRALLEGMMRKLATDHTGLEILHLGDCFRLLATVSVGRVGFSCGGEVLVLPVIFLVDGQDVVFRAKAGSKLAGVEVGQFVAFEVDSYDAAMGAGWSVVVRGLAEVQPGTECARLDALGMQPWGGPAEDQAWVRIRPESTTGRRIAET